MVSGFGLSEIGPAWILSRSVVKVARSRCSCGRSVQGLGFSGVMNLGL